MKSGISGDRKIILNRWNGLFLNYSEFIFWDFGLTSGRLKWSIKFNPPSLSKPPFGLSRFSVHGLKCQLEKVTESQSLITVDEWGYGIQ